MLGRCDLNKEEQEAGIVNLAFIYDIALTYTNFIASYNSL